MKIIISDLGYNYDNDNVGTVVYPIKKGGLICIDGAWHSIDRISITGKLGVSIDAKPANVKGPVPGIYKFVKLGDIELRWSRSRGQYWRDGGNWGVGYRLKDGKLYSVDRFHRHLSGVELTPITEQEWRAGNGRYANLSECDE